MEEHKSHLEAMPLTLAAVLATSSCSIPGSNDKSNFKQAHEKDSWWKQASSNSSPDNGKMLLIDLILRCRELSCWSGQCWLLTDWQSDLRLADAERSIPHLRDHSNPWKGDGLRAAYHVHKFRVYWKAMTQSRKQCKANHSQVFNEPTIEVRKENK